jgi:hypothetical protein
VRPILLLAASTAACALAACATPEPPAYAPISETVRFGYRDRPNADGGHTLLVVMPAHSKLADAHAYWERRAAELCPAGVAKRNVFRSDRKEHMAPAGYVHGSVGVGTRYPVGYEIEGYVYCKAAEAG